VNEERINAVESFPMRKFGHAEIFAQLPVAIKGATSYSEFA